MTTLNVETFRKDWPEFVVAQYPDEWITFWSIIADKLMSQDRWGNMRFVAMALFTAHNLVLEKQARDASRIGGSPGQATGAIAGRSVDKASVTYDANITSVEGYGNFNLTTYGTRLAFLIECFGAGPVQVGIGCGWPGTVF